MPIELPAIPKVSQQPTLQPHKDTANIVLFKKESTYKKCLREE